MTHFQRCRLPLGFHIFLVVSAPFFFRNCHLPPFLAVEPMRNINSNMITQHDLNLKLPIPKLSKSFKRKPNNVIFLLFPWLLLNLEDKLEHPQQKQSQKINYYYNCIKLLTNWKAKLLPLNSWRLVKLRITFWEKWKNDLISLADVVIT